MITEVGVMFGEQSTKAIKDIMIEYIKQCRKYALTKS